MAQLPFQRGPMQNPQIPGKYLGAAKIILQDLLFDISDIVSSMTSNMKPYKSNKSYKYCGEYCVLEHCEKVAKMRLDRKYMKMIKERKVDY